MAQSFKEKIKQYLLRLAGNKKRSFSDAGVWFILLVFSFVYRFLLSLRFFLYQLRICRARVHPLKVISVGNITVGGTGKTPLAQLIIGLLIGRQRHPALISRGYTVNSRSPSCGADEPEMLKVVFPSVPVLINKNRNIAAAAANTEHGCDCVVLDDGLQNLSIAKDLEIVCIDCRNPFGNGRLIPAGTMRVPLLYLRKADFIVLTHRDSAPENISVIKRTVLRYNKKAAFLCGRHSPRFFSRFVSGRREELSVVFGKKTALLCAIAAPRGFEDTVFALGAHIVLRYFFDDHHCFENGELTEIFRQCRRQGIETILTTAKDEPRLRAALGAAETAPEIMILHIALQLENDEAILDQRIHSLFSA